MITKLIDLLLPYQEYSYPVILLILIACGLGLPIPEEITLAVGGVLTSYKITNFWYTVLVCLIGVLGGDIIIYSLGRFFGNKILKSKILSKMIKSRHLALVRLASFKYGNSLIVFARFMPGVRTPIYFSMGMFKKPFHVFLTVDGITSIISVPIWVYIGMLFGDNIPALEHYIKQMEHGMYILLAILIVIIFLFHLLKKKFSSYLFSKAKTEQ
jgi:membrane protein DedA with SNARE-associated domain